MMRVYTVKRTIDGKFFLKDEDRISARSWIHAYFLLIAGRLSGRFDKFCRINGLLISDVEVSDDDMLDIMIMNKKIKKHT